MYELREPNQLRREYHYALRIVLAGIFAMYAVDYLYGLIYSTFASRNLLFSDEMIWKHLSETGWVMIWAEGVAALLCVIFFAWHRKIPSFRIQRAPLFSQMLQFYFCVMGLQMIASILAYRVENILNLFGFTLMEASEAASGASITISMLVYSVLLAPIFEEYIFRGPLLRLLSRYGKIPAIVLTSLVFGLMHGNIVQLPIAFLAGLLFGYIALEYSLAASMVVHSMSNATVELFGLMDLYVWDASLIDGLLTIVGVVVLVICLISYRKRIRDYLQMNRGEGGALTATLTSVSFWLMVALLGLTTGMSVAPL